MNSGNLVRYGGQAIFYLAFVAVVAYLSTSPVHTFVPSDHARVTVTFAHLGEREGECRPLTEEEKAALPPNMRVEEKCPRGRVPITVEIWLDGEMIYGDTIAPTGLHRDGRSYVYHAVTVPEGRHYLTMKMRDQVETDEFNYVQKKEVTLQGGQSLVIDFSAQAGGFVLRNVDLEAADVR